MNGFSFQHVGSPRVWYAQVGAGGQLVKPSGGAGTDPVWASLSPIPIPGNLANVAGLWDAAVTSPDALNTEAAALGPQVNVFASGGKLVPTSPAFIPFQPTVYPRPFNRPPFSF